MKTHRSFQLFTFLSGWLLAFASVAHAQGIRISGTTMARYIDVKPITTQERVTLVPLTQDLNVNVWGLGTGVRLYSQLRFRAAAGDVTDIWPQSNDNFDVLAAYAELDRARFRVRAGRQWKASPLGFYNYDGASLLVRATPVVRAELYGGWSLLAGESDYLPNAVSSTIEPYRPDKRNNLVGGEVHLHLSPSANVSALYQREIRTDRAGLYSERASADASFRAGIFSFNGGIQSNLASNQINQARAQVSAPLPGRITGSLEARRYRPYFDLWTIWGFFNPIGFKEALANARWANATGSATLHLGGGLRQYDDDKAGVQFDRLREDGWRAVADFSFMPTSTMTLIGSYQADIGFGASKSDGSLSARYNLGESSYLSASAMAFQQVQELDVREGTVYGFGTDASFKLSNVSRLGWSMAVYRHNNQSPADEIDWSQMRGSLWLEWAVGSNPDVRRVATARKP